MQLAAAVKEGSAGPSPLLPDVLLPDERLLVDALRSLEVKGPQHRLLLKKLRFNASEENLSKPQLVSLLEVRSTLLCSCYTSASNQTDVRHNAAARLSSALHCMNLSSQGLSNAHSRFGATVQLSE